MLTRNTMTTNRRRNRNRSATSDVDLILILPDDASRDDQLQLRDEVVRIEALHGFRDESSHSRSALGAFMRPARRHVALFDGFGFQIVRI